MLLRVCFWSLLFALLTSSAGAQEAQKRAVGDICAGYSLVAPNFGDRYLSGPAENGTVIGGDLRFARLFAFTAEADWMSVTYGTQLSSSTYTAMGGGRVFYPPSERARVRVLADVLAGATNVTRMTGINLPFTGNVAPAVAADGGAELRLSGPFAVRVEGGFLHSGYKPRFPDSEPQSSLHNQHGRVLVEGVWRF